MTPVCFDYFFISSNELEVNSVEDSGIGLQNFAKNPINKPQLR